MRPPLLAFLALALPATGCSLGIAKSGEDPHYSPPSRVKELADTEPMATQNGACSRLTFRTKRKIASPCAAYESAKNGILTFGLSEFVYFPWQVYETTRTVLFGREVVVQYDAVGSVCSVSVGGEQVYQKPYTR